MPFIGNKPSNNFVSLKRQDITGDGTASYTLDYKVASVNDILVYVNHVKQDPSSMTVSGTSLTMGGTVASTDDFYVIFLGQALQTVTPADNTITNAMLKTSVINSQTAETSPATGDEVLIYDTSATALRKMTKENLVKRPFAHFMHNSGSTNVGDSTSDGVQHSIQYVDKEEGITVSTTNNNWTHSETGYYNLSLRYRQDTGDDVWTVFGVLKGGNSGTCVGASTRTGSENNINEGYSIFYKVDSTTSTYQVNGWTHTGTKTVDGSFSAGKPGWSGYEDVIGTTGANVGIAVDYIIVKVGEL